MTRTRLSAGILLLALFALPVAASLAVAQETPPEQPKAEEPGTEATKADAEKAPEAKPPGGTDWTFKASEEGISIAQGEHFSLEAHVLLQPELTREHLFIEFNGGLYDWFNALDPLTQEQNAIPNRKDTSYPYDDSFSILRARAIFEGHVFAPWLRFKLEGEVGEGHSEVLDAYLQLGDEKKIYGLVGQFRAPFDFFTNVEEYKQLFRSFSDAAEAVDPLYAPGVMGVGRFWDSRLVASLALQDSEAEEPRISGDTDRPQLAARIETQSKGGFDYDMTGLSRPTDLQYTFGLSYLDNYNGGEVDTETGMLCLNGLSEECAANPYSTKGWEAFFAIRGSALTLAASYQDLEWDDGGTWSNTPLPEAPNQIPDSAVSTFRRTMPFSVLQAEAGGLRGAEGPDLGALGFDLLRRPDPHPAAVRAARADPFGPRRAGHDPAAEPRHGQRGIRAVGPRLQLLPAEEQPQDHGGLGEPEDHRRGPGHLLQLRPVERRLHGLLRLPAPHRQDRPAQPALVPDAVVLPVGAGLCAGPFRRADR